MSFVFDRAIAVVAVMAVAGGCGLGSGRVAFEVEAPVGDGLAQVRDHLSIDPPRQTLWLSVSGRDGLERVAKLGEDSDRCTRIVWRPDGKQVGFLINDVHLDLYSLDGASFGSLELVEIDGYPGSREARDLLWSDGQIEYLDCPREADDCSPRQIPLP